MKYSLFFKFLLIFGAFGSIYYFWYKNQAIPLSFEVSSTFETKKDSSIASFGGSYEEDNIVISTTSPSIVIDTVNSVISSNIKSNIKEDDIILSLKNAFSEKYNKDVSNTSVFIENSVGNFIKGSVDFDNSGHTATFYAAKSLETNKWEIAAVENGVVACSDIDSYNFPVSIITQCYSYSSGTVVNR